MASAIFSICKYLSSGPWSALLTKYTGFCPCSVSLMRTALTASWATAKYRYRISPCTGRVRTGGSDNARFKCWSAFSHSSVHSNVDSFLRSLKSGRAC
ncbi:hypothetical protein QL285_094819 [Trifolium repens]|nr:hypothetical protein QL285_094819 [Trifolium repens]